MGVLFTYMFVHHMHAWGLEEARRGVRCPRAGVKNDCEPLSGCWELKQAPQQEQPGAPFHSVGSGAQTQINSFGPPMVFPGSALPPHHNEAVAFSEGAGHLPATLLGARRDEGVDSLSDPFLDWKGKSILIVHSGETSRLRAGGEEAMEPKKWRGRDACQHRPNRRE